MNSNATNRLQQLANLLIWAVVATYAVSFVWLNRDSGEVGLTFWWGVEPRPRPAVLVVLAGFLGGLLVTAALTLVGALRRVTDQRALRRRIAGLEAELQRLRNLPLEEDLHAPPEPEPEAEPQGDGSP